MRVIVFVLLGLSLFVSGCEAFEDEVDDGPVTVDGDWVPIVDGRYEMGSRYATTTSPVHAVYVPAFNMKRTEVTVAEYAQCVNRGICTEPVNDYSVCNWDTRDQNPSHPVNCVTWQQANEYCRSIGARLPSEAEWEYAARSAGTDYSYPWGKEPPSCKVVVMADLNGIPGCGTKRTWPVCSKPYGNTGHGLCDMAGNVQEWVQDHHHLNYDGEPPTDGSAWEDPDGKFRVLRGAAFDGRKNYFFEATSRSNAAPSTALDSIGFRCVKDAAPSF